MAAAVAAAIGTPRRVPSRVAAIAAGIASDQARVATGCTSACSGTQNSDSRANGIVATASGRVRCNPRIHRRRESPESEKRSRVSSATALNSNRIAQKPGAPSPRSQPSQASWYTCPLTVAVNSSAVALCWAYSRNSGSRTAQNSASAATSRVAHAA